MMKNIINKSNTNDKLKCVKKISKFVAKTALKFGLLITMATSLSSFKPLDLDNPNEAKINYDILHAEIPTHNVENKKIEVLIQKNQVRKVDEDVLINIIEVIFCNLGANKYYNYLKRIIIQDDLYCKVGHFGGFYNPLTKEITFDLKYILEYLKYENQLKEAAIQQRKYLYLEEDLYWYISSMLVHEFSHHMHFIDILKNDVSFENKFNRISWKSNTMIENIFLFNHLLLNKNWDFENTDFYSDYAMTNSEEDFAESMVSLFMLLEPHLRNDKLIAKIINNNKLETKILLLARKLDSMNMNKHNSYHEQILGMLNFYRRNK